MSRLSLFNSPLLLGFDHFERTLDRIAKAGAEGYPPYNVEQIGDDRLRTHSRDGLSRRRVRLGRRRMAAPRQLRHAQASRDDQR